MFFLAIRNLILQRKRYAMIGIAVIVGFALITIITGIAYGAMETIKAKASRYFSGHVSITGYNTSFPKITDPAAMLAALSTGEFSTLHAARRTIYYRSDLSLFFGGETVRQRRLVGIDFMSERSELSKLTFSQGTLDSMLGAGGVDGILISEAAAKILGARLGDEVNLYLTTDSGQYTTAYMVIRGIFAETSIFSYIAYIRNEDLNRLLLRDPEAATDIAIFTEAGKDVNILAERIRLFLSSRYDVFPTIATKADLNKEIAKAPPGEKLAVLSLDAHLAQIKDLMDALLAITYFVLVIFVIIVMVGILNTYQVIVYERTSEIGTMRALGMGRAGVLALFLFEALGLAVTASGVGLFFGYVALWAFQFLNLQSIPLAGMFTDQGRLRFFLDPYVIAINLGLMVGAVVLAALGPSRKASMIRPIDAMSKVF